MSIAASVERRGLGGGRRTGDEIDEGSEFPFELIAEEIGVDPPRLAFPRMVVAHGQEEAQVRVGLSSSELVEKRGRGLVAVGADEWPRIAARL